MNIVIWRKSISNVRTGIYRRKIFFFLKFLHFYLAKTKKFSRKRSGKYKISLWKYILLGFVKFCEIHIMSRIQIQSLFSNWDAEELRNLTLFGDTLDWFQSWENVRSGFVFRNSTMCTPTTHHSTLKSAKNAVWEATSCLSQRLKSTFKKKFERSSPTGTCGVNKKCPKTLML